MAWPVTMQYTFRYELSAHSVSGPVIFMHRFEIQVKKTVRLAI